MESEVWKELGVEPVAFMPASYVEGPLHGLADGGDLDTLVPGNVQYLGGSMWRNTVLWDMVQVNKLNVGRAAGGCEELGRRVHHQTRAGGERDDMLERSVHGPLRRDPGERG
jgi:hypothetical protein